MPDDEQTTPSRPSVDRVDRIDRFSEGGRRGTEIFYIPSVDAAPADAPLVPPEGLVGTPSPSTTVDAASGEVDSD